MRTAITIVVGLLLFLTTPIQGDPTLSVFSPAYSYEDAKAASDWVLARALEKRILAESSGMSSMEQLTLYLGKVRLPTGTSSARQSTQNRLERFLRDPAVSSNFSTISDEWFKDSLTEWHNGPSLFSTTRELVQCKVMIARNLYFRGTAPTKENVRHEYERIQALRDRYGSMRLFSGRNVVFATSADQMRNGDHIFGRPPVVRWMNRKADNMSFLRKGENGERPGITRARLGKQLSAFDRLTFVFEGHGRPDAIKFIGSLSPREVVERLVERPNREMSLSGSNPWSVVIFNACQSHRFSRRLLEIYRRSHPHRQLPVVIVPVEFGDDLVKSVYSDPFLKGELRLSYNTNNHLGALFNTMKIGTSVYVPDEENVLTQIA